MIYLKINSKLQRDPEFLIEAMKKNPYIIIKSNVNPK